MADQTVGPTFGSQPPMKLGYRFEDGSHTPLSHLVKTVDTGKFVFLFVFSLPTFSQLQYALVVC